MRHVFDTWRVCFEYPGLPWIFFMGTSLEGRPSWYVDSRRRRSQITDRRRFHHLILDRALPHLLHFRGVGYKPSSLSGGKVFSVVFSQGTRI